MRGIFRRQFLIAAGVSAGAAMTSQGNNEKKINVAMMGTQHGHFEGKLRAVKESPHYELSGVHEPHAEVQKQKKAEPRYRDLPWKGEEEILGDPAVDLVVVECRIWEAIPWGRKVIDAGKHLHLEKPPSPDMAPFKQLVEDARRQELLLQMGYVWRFHPALEAAFEAARQGWLGDVYMLRGTINKDLEQERRASWAKYKGGTMFELGGHVIDRMVDFWGRPSKVTPFLQNDTLQDGLADNTVAVLQYDEGLAVATSSVWMAGSGDHRSFEILGTDGSFILQPAEPGSLARVVMRRQAGPYQKGWQEVRFPAHRRYVGDFEELARALKSGDPLRYDYDYELTLHETLLRASDQYGET